MADAGAKLLRGLLDVFVLASLERSPKHGYALLREMSETFGTTPNRNRLYPLLGRMVGEGLVAERSEPSGTRTLYALTDLGRDALHAYRRLPPAFHEGIARIWSPPPPAAAPRAVQASGKQDAEPTPAAAEGELPYPCPEARVTIEKAPRTGDVSIRLVGCPMGAYEYCPLCPVSRGIDGLRKLTFS